MNIQNKLRAAIQELPLVLANEAVNFTLDNFKMQSWQDGGGLEAWAE